MPKNKKTKKAKKKTPMQYVGEKMLGSVIETIAGDPTSAGIGFIFSLVTGDDGGAAMDQAQLDELKNISSKLNEAIKELKEVNKKLGDISEHLKELVDGQRLDRWLGAHAAILDDIGRIDTVFENYLQYFTPTPDGKLPHMGRRTFDIFYERVLGSNDSVEFCLANIHNQIMGPTRGTGLLDLYADMISQRIAADGKSWFEATIIKPYSFQEYYTKVTSEQINKYADDYCEYYKSIVNSQLMAIILICEVNSGDTNDRFIGISEIKNFAIKMAEQEEVFILNLGKILNAWVYTVNLGSSGNIAVGNLYRYSQVNLDNADKVAFLPFNRAGGGDEALASKKYYEETVYPNVLEGRAQDYLEKAEDILATSMVFSSLREDFQGKSIFRRVIVYAQMYNMATAGHTPSKLKDEERIMQLANQMNDLRLEGFAPEPISCSNIFPMTSFGVISVRSNLYRIVFQVDKDGSYSLASPNYPFDIEGYSGKYQFLTQNDLDVEVDVDAENPVEIIHICPFMTVAG
ncbi:hypothetical protein QWY85_16945 [Neolewinella lacunae]|uniref:Uncharacterized protein n=1 Tax=Neolewinella lacunae TaxID=1517758 RepID=A0A923PIT0_9BACT|nr:hypothetical protein [Neolewinella lacunae]MBC6993365.1 hypothetical protein [Neolewinella lacunae]MDN3636355.1 hypothetical protein [Neolewinella lacunae]